MRTKSILLLFVSVLFFGCKSDKTETNTPEAAKEEVAKGFKVSLNVIVKQDDNFSLFYTEDGSIDFKGDPIWVNVKGSDAEQTVTYTLPEDAFPTQLRLDFGITKEQEDIVLKSILLEYNGKQRIIAQGEINNFFRPDENKCSFDKATGVLKPVVKDGVRQNPSLYPQEAFLKPEMEKLAK